MSEGLENVLNKLIADYKNIAFDAVTEAAHKAQKDILDEANNYLDLYYASYKPDYYKRTYNLHRAIQPYWQNNSSGNIVSIGVGVKYDSSVLENTYLENTWDLVNGKTLSGDYEFADGEKIVNNFLSGKHGRAKQIDSKNTNSLMPHFINNDVKKRIDKYMSSAFLNAINNRL